MRVDSLAEELNLICCAKEHCKVLNVGQTFQCNLCGLNYHIDCVFPNLLHREFSFALRCGCDVKVIDEGYELITIFFLYEFVIKFYYLVVLPAFDFNGKFYKSSLECQILKSRTFPEVRHNF